MDEAVEVQAHRDLSLEYYDLARIAWEAGRVAPSRHNALHALELGVKAALAHALGSAPRTHNVGGEFGRLFRARVGDDVTRRINRLLAGYDGPRYPEWDAPPTDRMEADLEFIGLFLTRILDELLREEAR